MHNFLHNTKEKMMPHKGDLIVKGKSGLCSFASTNLDFLLRQKNIKNVVLSGFLTNWYVGQFVTHMLYFMIDLPFVFDSMFIRSSYSTIRKLVYFLSFTQLCRVYNENSIRTELQNLYDDWLCCSNKYGCARSNFETQLWNVQYSNV